MVAASSSRIWFVLISSVAVSGCVNTTINSVPNRWLPQESYSRILVVGNFGELAVRQAAEYKTCLDMNEKTATDCVPSAGVLFPGSPINAESLRRAVEKVGADAVLVIGSTGSGSSSVYIPPTTQTRGSATVFGNTVSAQSTTRTYGGYNVSKPWAGFEVVLFSVRQDQRVWYATASTGGNAFSSWDDLIDAASGKTVARLVEDGVLSSR